MTKTLYQKLEIREGFKSAVIGYKKNYNLLVVGDQPFLFVSSFNQLSGFNYDFVHIFTNDLSILPT